MTDYISREWLMEHLDIGMNMSQIMHTIIDAPAADAVEVVQCRECCRYDPERNYCENTGCEWDPWEFCSDGERKDGDGDG